MAVRSIPPKGSIPNRKYRFVGGSVGRLTRSVSDSDGHLFEPNVWHNAEPQKKISLRGFKEKLVWLRDHLTELEKFGASKDKIEFVAGQISHLERFMKEIGC